MKRKFLFGLVITCIVQTISMPVFAYTPNDPLFSEQWYLSHVSAEAAWDVTQGSADVIVAVIDTGVDIEHEDLRENIWTNADEIADNGKDDDGNGYVDDVHGWNFLDASNDVRPPSGKNAEGIAVVHGTLISSVIAARGNNGKGVAGVSWYSRIMPIVALDDQGSGSTTDVANAIYYAVRNGADVINLSIEGSMDDPYLNQALKFAYSRGVLTVAAAGNSDEDGGQDLDAVPVYPACLSSDESYGLIAVGGTDEGDIKATFSDYGSCVSLVAPSTNITGASVSLTHRAYASGWDGTSVAVPIVSGAIALIKAKHPEWTAAHVRERLVHTAIPLDDLNPSYKDGMGTGRLSLSNALTEIDASKAVFEVQASKPGRATEVILSNGTDTRKGYPFGEDDLRGARVAFADPDHDGNPDLGIVPASGTKAEIMILSGDGFLRKRIDLPGHLTSGALIAGTDDGFVVADADGGTAWGIDAEFKVRPFFPYETQYQSGVDLLSVAGGAAFAPRDGGGRLVVSNAKGEQIVSAFPFGLDPSGRWSLARMTVADGEWIVFSGPNGTKRIPTGSIGQIGWEDVSFEQLSSSTLLQSSGRPVKNTTSYDIYDSWPRL